MAEERFSRASITLAQLALGAIILATWQAGATLKLLDPFFFSRPTDIAGRVALWVANGSLWRHLVVTLQEAVLGLIIGAAIGITLGFVLARSPFAARVLDPYIAMLNAIPRVVLAPLFLLWFGLGIWSKVALAVTLVFFIMFFNTYQGVRDADRGIIDRRRRAVVRLLRDDTWRVCHARCTARHRQW